jgi:pimeloyl-ACP methyl ester carboxylesterase
MTWKQWVQIGLAMLAIAITPAWAADAQRPILFVHGSGDSAALWQTTIWRFESNGYDPTRLIAIDFPHPQARAADSIPEPNRSSTTDQLTELGAAVTKILAETHQEKIILIGSSRGGNAIRNYIRNGGGQATVALAILAGTPNHGVYARVNNPDAEFNGEGRFLKSLNQPYETDPGVRFVTLRSDHNDKYAQPTGEFLGQPGVPTEVTYDGPALDGAENIVLPGLDHREVAFHRLAFAAMCRAITGGEPATLDPIAIEEPLLSGVVSGYENGAATNLPLANATVDLYQVDPETGERLGDVVWHQRSKYDGRWGPFKARADAYYEFVIAAEGYPTTHIYRTPFPRSSRYVQIRLQPIEPKHRDAGAIVTLTRPRGYLGHGRDNFTINGRIPEGVNDGVPGTPAVTVRFPASPQRSVPVVLNHEHLMVRTYPLADGQTVLAEFHD